MKFAIAIVAAIAVVSVPALGQQTLTHRHTGQAWNRGHTCDLVINGATLQAGKCALDPPKSVYEPGGFKPWETSEAVTFEDGAYRLYYGRSASSTRAGSASYEEFVPRGTSLEWNFYSSGSGTKTRIGLIPL